MHYQLIVFALSLGILAMPPDTVNAEFVRSPEVHTDGRVTLRYFAPAAKQVSVSSNVAAIQQPMTRDEQGVWSGHLPRIPMPTALTSTERM